MLETFGTFLVGVILYLAYKIGYEEGKNDEEERQRLMKIRQMMGKGEDDVA